MDKELPQTDNKKHNLKKLDKILEQAHHKRR